MRSRSLPFVLASVCTCVALPLAGQTTTSVDSIAGRMPITVPFSVGSVAEASARTLQSLGYQVLESTADPQNVATLRTAPRFTWPSYLGNVATLDRTVRNPGFTLEVVVSPTTTPDSATFEVRMRYATPSIDPRSLAVVWLPLVSVTEVAAAVCSALDSTRVRTPTR